MGQASTTNGIASERVVEPEPFEVLLAKGVERASESSGKASEGFGRASIGFTTAAAGRDSEPGERISLKAKVFCILLEIVLRL